VKSANVVYRFVVNAEPGSYINPSFNNSFDIPKSGMVLRAVVISSALHVLTTF